MVQQRGYFADDVCSADTVIKRINTYGWKRILVDLKVINGQLFKGWVDKPKGNVYVAVDYHDIQAISRRNVIGNRGRKNAMM